MNKLSEQRKRAVDIWLRIADTSVPTLIDHYLDSYLREHFKLPELPQGQMPYEGWMIGKSTKTPDKQRISPKGVALIKRWEGCRLKAYLCPANVWTVGYGHTKTVKPGQRINQAQANALLAKDLVVYEEAVRKHVTSKLTQHQFDALVSLCFNIGVGAFRNSTLVRLLNQKRYSQAADEFDRWVYADSKRLPGLVSRRKAEKKLFNS